MKNFNFWQKWLLGFGVYLVGFGVLLSFFSHSPLMNFIFNHQIDPTFWGAAELPENTLRFQSWIYGVLGAMLAGWGVFIAFIAAYPFKAQERWAWNCIATGFIVWFVIDTIISAHYRVGFNVAINIIFLICILLPLVFTRKYFVERK